ncbi:hypothetical protein J4Q44_G00294180 [Coregonus suidteri]|uniref:Uncharacterized protein n=1 Tax=Coregonus suidteri TaxID=861788 RepID=A0AAN8L4Q3_9TELE
MSSLSYSPPAKEEEVCWTEKEALVKEEEEEEDVTIQKQVEGEAVTVKEEEKEVTVKEEEDAFRVKEEEDVTVKEEDAFRVKEEEDAFRVKEEEDDTVKEEEEDAFRVKEEEDDTVKAEEDAVFGMKEEEEDLTVTVKEEEDVFGVKEEGEITVTLEEEEEEQKTGDLINTSKYSVFMEGFRKTCEGPNPNDKLKENCDAKFKRVQQFVMYMAKDEIYPSTLAFLKNHDKMRRWVQTLHKNKDIATVTNYTLTIGAFLQYAEETPPPGCRLTRNQWRGINRVMKGAASPGEGQECTPERRRGKFGQLHAPRHPDGRQLRSVPSQRNQCPPRGGVESGRYHGPLREPSLTSRYHGRLREPRSAQRTIPHLQAREDDSLSERSTTPEETKVQHQESATSAGGRGGTDSQTTSSKRSYSLTTR